MNASTWKRIGLWLARVIGREAVTLAAGKLGEKAQAKK